MKGYIQVYTGNGKGKTTAALGLAVRALGAGKRVLFLQFMKALAYSEHKIMKNLGPELEIECFGKPFFIAIEGSVSEEEMKKWKDDVVVFPSGNPPSEYLELIRKGAEKAMDAVKSGAYDLVVLDEIICALAYGLIGWGELLSIIDAKAENTELVMTGRGASQELIDRADLVTEMKEIKHYYNTKGVIARRGIEN